MKKMLMLASVVSMIDLFNMSNIDILKKQGYEVHVATNFEYVTTSSKERVEEFKKELEDMGILYFQVDFSRKITDLKSNIKAYKQIKDMMLENKYEFVHCHSPIGGVCGRLAAHSTNTPAIYTAHGFHFFKGAPLKNWLLFYSVERWLARYTDVLITINKEDYAIAQNFKAKKVTYVPGIGVDTKKFSGLNVDRDNKRKELGIPDETVVLISIGELIKRKNHETVLKAIAKVDKINLLYLICGRGELEDYLRKLAKKLGIQNKVQFLGFRNDISEICVASDVFVFPSYQEGLPVALMEAMSADLPIVCSKIRGNTDLIEDGKGGYLVEPGDVNGYEKSINKVLNDVQLRKKMGTYNVEEVKKYDKETVKEDMIRIYEDF